MNGSGSLIQNGTVYDGLGNPPQQVDVRIVDGVIQEVGPQLIPAGEELIDASGLIVAPGLIDLHVHVFSGIGIYSVDPVEAGLRTGVTSMLDTGTAGSLTYANLARFIIPAAEEDIFALLNISMIGAIQGHPDYPPYTGDLNDARHANVEAAVACVNRYPDRIVGLKVRLTSVLANSVEANEWAGFHGVLEAAEQTGRPCMIHHANSKIPTDTVLDAMRSGDTYTHLYHPHADHIFDDSGEPLAAAVAARERSVFFDVGHGVGAFSWRVAEPACCEFGFWPDTISTDVHAFNLQGPVFDLPTTMSKFLHLGMPLKDVVKAATSTPARAMQVQDQLGSLTPGMQADVVLLDLERGEFSLMDSEQQVRQATQRFVPVSVCKSGRWRGCGGTFGSSSDRQSGLLSATS